MHINRFPRWRRATAVAVLALAAATVPTAQSFASSRRSTPQVTSAAPLAVEGNQLVAGGAPVTLVGANRAGTEYACAQGWGIFDGPSTTASLEAMRAWGINTVRVPLNEDCWLGVNVPTTYSGATYRSAISAYVARIQAAGMYAILDLHWGAPGTTPALGQEAMPDASHAVSFWSSVATTFRADPEVLFELFNEPHGVSWSCWENGCSMPGGWTAVGMQQLVDTVRGAGADQPIILDGLGWANDLTGWLAHLPSDPLHELVAGFHVYPWTACASTTCWSSEVAPVAAKAPVVTTEVGENDCAGTFAQSYIDWAGHHGVSPVAWTWDTDEGCFDLVQNYSGTPTTYGDAVRSAFQKLAAAG